MSKFKDFGLLTVLLTITINIAAQSDYKTYYATINKSKTFKETDSILKYRLNALKFAKPLPNDILSISFYYFENNNIPEAKHYFREAFKNGYQIETDEEFKDLPLKTEYDFGFITKYENSKTRYGIFLNTMFTSNKFEARKLRKEFIKNIDRIEDANYEILLQNELNFQKIRFEILPTREIPDSTLTILYKYLNIGNSYYMLDLLQNDKFPSRYKCRRFSDQSIAMLINHAIAGFAKKEDAKLFMDLLWKQVETGNLSADYYSKAMDHYTSWYEDHKKSLLGTSTVSEDFKTFQCIDVINPEELNEIRAKYWLEPIEQYCKSAGILLPKNYTIK
ncbi:hypothetical protein FLAN108750_09840 [Flavobacterium antarcticum]|uniref:hypothetical protein n=1 Tax=Flavobacterium antarcticum TaxID=271155 RepID=UPI0003B4F95F|nr:hypothetical protein [Flavobacterium antarcticum]